MKTTMTIPFDPLIKNRAVKALTAAFAADPAIRWMYPDEEQYQRWFPRFALAFAGRAFEHGAADVSDSTGAALWLRPGVEPDEAAVMEVLQRSVSEELLPEVFSVLEQMARSHPSGPHWYLPLIGVDPAAQGCGAGSELLRTGLARCDRDGAPAYLESTSLRSVPLYRRFGFEVVGEIQAGTSPVITPMIRPAY